MVWFQVVSSYETTTFPLLVQKLIALLLIVCCGACSRGTRYGNHFHPVNYPVYHHVQTGENLHRIGLRYHQTPKRLALMNGIHSSRDLRIGQRLFVGYRQGKAGGIQRANIRNQTKLRPQDAHSATGRLAGKGVMYTDGVLAWPVEGGEIVSGFGPRGSAFHDGLDITAPSGTPVYAAHDGVVIYSDNELSGYGNLIILRDQKGVTTVYGHNRRLHVSVGEKVKRGSQIAEIGTTGHATGPHLHFEVRTKDSRGRFVALDPLPLFKKMMGEHPRYRVNESLTPILVRVVGPSRTL